MSHAEAYAEIARRGLPCALVLEDDAVLHKDLPSILRKLESGILEQGDVVFLERCDTSGPFPRERCRVGIDWLGLSWSAPARRPRLRDMSSRRKLPRRSRR